MFLIAVKAVARRVIFDPEEASMRFFFVAVMIIVFGILVFLSNDFNRLGVFGSGGFKKSGSKLGVSIGMDIAELDAKFKKRGLKIGEPTVPGTCLGRATPPDQTLVIWDDLSWHHGVICVWVKDGAVHSFAWSYGGWQF